MMDIILFLFFVALSFIFTILTMIDKEAPYFAIIGGILFILLGLFLTSTTGNIEQQYCDFPILNFTETITTNLTNPNITTETRTVTNTISAQCHYELIDSPWHIREFLGAIFIFMGLGVFLSFYTSRKNKEE